MHCEKNKIEEHNRVGGPNILELLHCAGCFVVVVGAEGGDGGHVVVVVGLGAVVVDGFAGGVFGDVFCVC